MLKIMSRWLIAGVLLTTLLTVACQENPPPSALDDSLQKPNASFVLTSSDATDGGLLPRVYTGDGESATLPLSWKGAPEGTKSYAVIMHHIPGPGTVKWYWILYNIPATVEALPKNVKGIGTLGNNSVNKRTEYAPPHSKGPGPKKYIYTVYALSAEPQIDVPPEQVNREVLLAAMKDKILATATLSVTYSRPEGATEQRDEHRPDPPPPPPPGEK